MIEVLVIVISPFVGSFLALVADRLPAGRRVLFGRSACASCGRPIAARDLVPLFSFFCLRGRARCCGAPIPVSLPAIEAAALAIALLAAWRADGALFLCSVALGWTLLLLAVIDARVLRLPDVLTVPLTLAGLGLSLAWVLGPFPSHLAGAAVGWALLAGIDLIHRRLRGQAGIGGGDAKLLAAAGAWLGLAWLGHVLMIAAISGLAVAVLRGRAQRGVRLAFGPYLAAGFFAVWMVQVAGG